MARFDDRATKPVRGPGDYWAEHGLPPERLWICDVGEARPLVR